MAQSNSYHDDEKTVTVIHRPESVMRRARHEIAHYIVVVEGSEAGKKLELGLRPVRLGRHQNNDLILADPFVSGHHCTVFFESGAVKVMDTGSTNGTFIDGDRITGQAIWPDSASLQIGNQVLCREYRAREEMERSTQLVSDIQQAADYMRSLLPAPLTGGIVNTDWHYAPSAELGGDIFDYHWLDSLHFVFYLIDVCGHGVGAALHSVSVSNLLRQRSLPGVDFSRPSQVLQALNRLLPMEQYGSMYFTLWYGVYNRNTRGLGYASAGHPPALLFSRRGQQRPGLVTDNPPIGVLDHIQFQEASTTLEPGSILYLYSDGVFEVIQKSGEWWSREAFADYLQQQLHIDGGRPEGIYRSIKQFIRAESFNDDFSLMRVNFEG